MDYNNLQLQFKMVKSNKTKVSFQLILNTSLAVNFLSLLVIFIMAYRYYQLTHNKSNQKKENRQQQTTQAQSTATLQETHNDQQTPQQCKVAQGEEKSIKNTSKLQTQPETAILQERIRQKEKEIASRIETQSQLRHEVQLQQERGRFLQEKVNKLELLIKFNGPRLPSFGGKQTNKPSTQSTAMADLRNQLEFCQKRLLVSQNTEKELRLKLHEYQKLGEYSLDHPEYLRLRQMNTRYKQIIANLQTYLLEKNQMHPNLNISFNDL